MPTATGYQTTAKTAVTNAASPIDQANDLHTELEPSKMWMKFSNVKEVNAWK